MRAGWVGGAADAGGKYVFLKRENTTVYGGILVAGEFAIRCGV